MDVLTDIVDALDLHWPGSIAEAAVLAGCLVLGAWAYFRAVGLPAAVLLTVGSVLSFVQIGHVMVPAAVTATGLLLWASAAFGGRGLLKPSWREFVRAMGLVLGGFALYEVGRILARGGQDQAIRDGEHVVSAERGLRLFVEPHIQDGMLKSDAVARGLNLVYSHGFLAATVAVLLWLYFSDQARYRVYRNSLGVSALLALPLIAVFPTAPPRLLPEAGLADTVVTFGHEHAFANQYAAIPSLHVGWMALAGYVLALNLRGWRRVAVAVLPGMVMLLTVVATGNHYWLDGLVGITLAVTPAIVMVHRESFAAWLRRLGPWLLERSAVDSGARTKMSALALGGLLTYLLVARVLNPGFTHFWGYLTAQTAIILVLLLLGEQVFARQGGLSWLTHLIAVTCTYADVLGTDGNLYARIAEYDKVTHFAGIAAITAGSYDCLRAFGARRGVGSTTARLWASVSIGFAVGVGWEVYEYLGDVVFHTSRTQGTGDTIHDLVFDALGALMLGVLLWRSEVVQGARPAAPESGGVPLV